jgi:hypothetical protein
LCPTCHALFHRGTLTRESIYVWKGILVALTQAFDVTTLDDLIFLNKVGTGQLGVSGDGVLKFSRLIAADLAGFRLLVKNGPLLLYEVGLTEKGRRLTDAWLSGNRQAVAGVLSSPEGAERPAQ